MWKVPLRLVLALPHGANCMDEGVFTHVLGGKGFSCEVGYPITEIVMTSCDEAALFAVQCVA